MLEPREADIPAVFLVLVVLPLVAYILLGKWSEAAKKRERISLLAQVAAEEAFRAEAMATASVIPLPSSLNTEFHQCARCSAPATTRCSRCKSVRYCSGKCQIIHWRQLHKEECHQLENTSSCSSPRASLMEESIHGSVLGIGNTNSPLFGYNGNHAILENKPSDKIIYPSVSPETSATAANLAADPSRVSMPERRTTEKRVSRKSNRVTSMRDDGPGMYAYEDASGSWNNNATSSNVPLKEAYARPNLRNNGSVALEEENSSWKICSSSSEYICGQTTSSSTVHEIHDYQSQCGKTLQRMRNCGSSLYSAINGENISETGAYFIPDGGNSFKGNTFNDESIELDRSSDNATKVIVKAKSNLRPRGNNTPKSPKSSRIASGEQLCPDMGKQGRIVDEKKAGRARGSIHAEGSHGAESVGIMKMMGPRKSTKVARCDSSEVTGDRHNKINMLFPYEDFVKFFHCEVFSLSPRGLINCGNSCYANAVLQCLTSTKPLIIYLVHRSHSRACVKNWCLMCDLEQHVMMLREIGGPLSPGRILLHMQRTNCQIGDGSQEDAHEFLRLLVASMQSMCLEGLGGEKKVDPRLQETTFIQHTFGGRLRSKVKCLRCHHDSERYENIMDLTLEIYGWVESLEDALTQFTTPEDLDGDNMYRCGRCAAYVRARKQLSIHEAPNILTIVLKRFQEGKYGKINKCITFPDMLDMIPYMTGTGDMPPLYMLYAVVVHLDTLNASFSGHYVSYVKDLQGNWFRIDDTEVQPVQMSQVMSEGAYILFYMRSYPRPQRVCPDKTTKHQALAPAKPTSLQTSKSGLRKPTSLVGPDPSRDHKSELSTRSANRNTQPMMDTFANPHCIEFSDAASSEWSLFTSSDDASFTTESTRDSFSFVDYGDTCDRDKISSIFNTIYPTEYSSNNTVSCRMSSNSRPNTRYVSEEKGYVLTSYLSAQPPDRVRRGDISNEDSIILQIKHNPNFIDSVIKLEWRIVLSNRINRSRTNFPSFCNIVRPNCPSNAVL